MGKQCWRGSRSSSAGWFMALWNWTGSVLLLGLSERYLSQKSRLFYEAGQAQGVAVIYGARLRLQRIRLEREHTARCQALGVAPSAFVEGVENIVPHLNRWLALGSSENPSGDCSGQVRTFQQTSLSGRASVCLEPVKVSNTFVTRWWLNPLIELNFSLEYNSQNLLLNVSAWSCTHFRGFEWNK